MSLNTAHADNGVLIHAGEGIVLFSDNVNVEFSGQESPVFRNSKTGRMYLTTHRMIFNAKSNSEPMQSFSFPFVTLSDVGVEQPVFGANYIKGKVRAQENGNWIGEAKFKLYFKSGGAIDFAQAMLKAAQMATRGLRADDAPPPYTPPTDPWYAAPPPAYYPPPQGYYGWIPPTNVFPDHPPPNSVYMVNTPPPYPGINVGPTPNQQASGYPPNYQGYPPNYQGYPPNYQGYPSGAPGFPPNYQGYSGQASGYPPQQPYLGAPNYPNPSTYSPQPDFTPGFSRGPDMGPGNAYGSSPSAPPTNAFNDAKAAEAAQSAYYDPNRPQMAYVPPPAPYEQPPSYQQATKKDQ